MDPKIRSEVLEVLRKQGRGDLVQAFTRLAPSSDKKSVTAADSYDLMYKLGTLAKVYVRTMLQEKRHDQISEALAAIIRASIPQALQPKVLKDLRVRLTAPKES